MYIRITSILDIPILVYVDINMSGQLHAQAALIHGERALG
jgi:hypothetical protein